MSRCRIEGCSNAAIANGLCAKHYMRVRRTGNAMGTHKPGPKPKPGGRAEKLATLAAEIARLKAENDELRQRRDTAVLQTRIIALSRQVAELQRQLQAKPKVLQAPPRSEGEAVAELERQLKAARTRIKNLTAEARYAWEMAKASPSTISKAQLRKLQKVFHPDPESATATAARMKELNEASQIFNAIKFRVREG